MTDQAKCNLCAQNSGEVASHGGILWQNDTWILRHFMKGRGVPGWLMLMTQRHVASFPQFDETECATFGPLMQVLQRTLLDLTGADKIYIANMNESTPHFHCHIVPRSHEMPLGAAGWKVFDLSRASLEGEFVVDDAESLRLCDELRERLRTLA